MTNNLKDKERYNSTIIPNNNTDYISIIRSFLKEIYKDIYKRSGRIIDKYSFHEVTKFPLIISEKIFFYLNNSHSDKLSLCEFVNGVYDLYYGNTDSKIDSLFNILDFTNSHRIHIEHVKLFFSYFHMMNLTLDSEYMLIDIINMFYNGKNVLTYKEYKHKVYTERNYDLIFLFDLFINKFAFFTSKQLSFYALINECTSSNSSTSARTWSNEHVQHNQQQQDESISNNYAMLCYEPNDICFEYAEVVMNSKPIEPLYTSHEDLDELNKLNNFECDMQNTMQELVNNNKERIEITRSTLNGSSEYDSMLNETENKSVQKYNKNKFMEFLLNKSFLIRNPLENENCLNILTTRSTVLKTNNNFNLNSNNVNKSKTLKNKSLKQSNFETLFTLPFYLNYSFNLHSQPQSNTNEYLMYTFKKASKLQKCKLTLIDNSIFYFKYNKQSKLYTFKKVFILSQLFPKTEQTIIIDKTTFHSLQLVSTFHNFKITKTFLSKSEQDINSLYNCILSNANYKKVDDYYQFGPEIGKGRFGKVNIGVSIGTNENVAIKIISKFQNDSFNEHSLADYSIMKWEQDIFRYLQNARHPNVVTCKFVFETAGYIYYVYELMTYGNLKAYLKSKTIGNDLSRRDCCEIAIQLLKGVSFLHSHGIIHRDIKHTNIMLSIKEGNEKEITVKIIDFGLSRVIGRYEMCNDPYGSLSFQAPEMLIGCEYGFKVDIWSLGVTLYFLLFKELPFDDKKTEVIKEMILYQNIQLPTDNDEPVDQMYSFICSLIFDCLKKNVVERPDIFGIVDKYFHTSHTKIMNTEGNNNDNDKENKSVERKRMHSSGSVNRMNNNNDIRRRSTNTNTIKSVKSYKNRNLSKTRYNIKEKNLFVNNNNTHN